jgi:DeoR family transcriptional regulator, suf operon transcriptional repressor
MSTPTLPTLPSDLPLAQRGPRTAILVELKRSPGGTVRALAAQLELSLNAVRAHLKELEAERLVSHERLAHGVGAPVYAYRLTPAGEALFPRRYEDALLRVLDHVAEREGRAAAVELLAASRFDALRARLLGELADAPPAERMRAVVRALSDQGYMAEGAATFCCGTLVQHNCAIRAAAERYPEICAVERSFLEEVLGGRVELRKNQLAGGCACEHKVSFASKDAELRFGAGTDALSHNESEA